MQALTKSIFAVFFIQLFVSNNQAVAMTEDKATCGLTGTVNERIQDCATRLPNWVALVTRDSRGQEVYVDLYTGKIWGDVIAKGAPQKAASKACSGILAHIGGLSEIKWRLPSLEDYEEAEKRRALDLIPNNNTGFWTSTTDYHETGMGYQFNGRVIMDKLKYLGAVRCVADYKSDY